MKILVLGSMQFSEKMLEVCELLRKARHQAVTSVFVEAFIGKTDEEKEIIKLAQKITKMRYGWTVSRLLIKTQFLL